MVFLLGVSIPEATMVTKALTSFYGIGPNVCARLCAKHSIHPMAKLASLQTPKLNELQADMAKMTLENDLRKELRDNIGRLRELGTYRGRRHAQGLPVRGQKTKKQVATARRFNTLERRG
ncbi:uncharacterized protein H6S33_010723 [Morchella sextelata]|uniref:uncharacterized protein n=1 Tax=Morchella sextelata TaxID=1174677 RepID=UPI001D04A13E|nr:uncharacterized protein H6S33_010723 [Morchella sextelata]KAH0611458.1 hypothetical protein H6S33_010723 [Morchella sextelata]